MDVDVPESRRGLQTPTMERNGSATVRVEGSNPSRPPRTARMINGPVNPGALAVRFGHGTVRPPIRGGGLYCVSMTWLLVSIFAGVCLAGCWGMWWITGDDYRGKHRTHQGHHRAHEDDPTIEMRAYG